MTATSAPNPRATAISAMPTSIQLIDGVGAMSAGGQGLAEVMAGHEDYGIVSIMGPQSSGKSTLMNKLFDTPFAVMDASKGRGQSATW